MSTCEGFWWWQRHRFDTPAWCPDISRKDDSLHTHPAGLRNWQARCAKCKSVIRFESAFYGEQPARPVMAAIVIWRESGRLPNTEAVNANVELVGDVMRLRPALSKTEEPQ